MAQTSFEIDPKMAEAIDRLKEVYGVGSNAAVLKRALALALVASRYADEDSNLHLLSRKEGAEREIVIAQRF